MTENLVQEVLIHAQTERVKLFNKYFKCYPGGYGEGDTFAGIQNPIIKSFAKKNQSIPNNDLAALLQNKVHEIRMLALYIFQFKFTSKKTTEEQKTDLIKIYLNNTRYINNWDLVDVSAHFVLGSYYFNKSTDIFFELAKSNFLWENRIAMIATFYNIRQNSFELSLNIAKILLHHPHDIIHKAVGWMLREVGNRSHQTELDFLKNHYTTMPRTMLRYAIEKFDEPLRQQFLKGTF